MNREQLVEKGAVALFASPAYLARTGVGMDDARTVLDAVLPQVSTAAERDALFQSVSENASPAVVISEGRPYIVTEDDRGNFWAHSYRIEGERTAYRNADRLTFPLTVVWQP